MPSTGIAFLLHETHRPPGEQSCWGHRQERSIPGTLDFEVNIFVADAFPKKHCIIQ